MIVVENLTKKYGEITALDNVTLSIPENAIYAIVGPNGAGKTTFLKILCQLMDFESGSVRIESGVRKNEFRKIMGYLPEQRGLYGGVDIATQLRYFAAIRGVPSKESRTYINYWLERFEIPEWKHRRISELSKGMQQKVQIISCLIGMPKLLFMDEPFSGVDPFNYRFFTEVLKEYCERVGATVVMSTHNMKSVDSFCTDVAFMKEGRVTVAGGTAGVREQFINDKLFDIVLLKNSKTSNADFAKYVKSAAFFSVEQIIEEGDCLIITVSDKDEHNTACMVKRIVDYFKQYDVVSCGVKRPTMEEIFLEIS